MGWLTVLVCAVPIYLFWKIDNFVLMSLAILNTLVNFWSFGVMHNYAINASVIKIKQLRENLVSEGRFDAEQQAALDRIPIQKNLDTVPNWISTINMATSIVGLFGLIMTLFIK